MSLEKEFLEYPESLELKGLGFDEPCFGRYDGKGKNKGKIWFEMPNGGQGTIPVDDVLAPTFSAAFRWFRKKGLNHHIETSSEDIQIAHIHSSHNIYVGSYSSYEEAELACVRKLIEIFKDGK